MLAIARALCRQPRVLLLDELSLGLAPVIVERLLPVVREFASTHGTAVLLVEQHVHLALEIADRGYVLSHGELVASDSAERLRADSALLTASYLGRAPRLRIGSTVAARTSPVPGGTRPFGASYQRRPEDPEVGDGRRRIELERPLRRQHQRVEQRRRGQVGNGEAVADEVLAGRRALTRGGRARQGRRGALVGPVSLTVWKRRPVKARA